MWYGEVRDTAPHFSTLKSLWCIGSTSLVRVRASTTVGHEPSVMASPRDSALVVIDFVFRSAPLFPQATELNHSIREMHAFLLQHFMGYVDVNCCLPSQVWLDCYRRVTSRPKP